MRTTEIEGVRSLDDVKHMTVDSPPVTPILFVPGVMGSRLTFDGVKWDPDTNLGPVPTNMVEWAAYDPMEAAKHLDGRGTPKAETMHQNIPFDARLASIWKAVDPDQRHNYYGELRGWSGVSRDYYYELLVSLEIYFNGFPFTVGAHPVHAFGYDWRRSNADSGMDLAAKIKSVSSDHGGAKVVVVTHSMGGLVARHAVHPKGGNVADKVKGVVHVMLPVNGATQSYRRFAEGVSVDRWASLKEGPIMAGIFGGSWWGYTLLMSGADGPVQLLPNHVYGDWLIDENGHKVPSSSIYAYYTSGSVQSLLPGLYGDFATRLSFDRIGNADDPLCEAAEELAFLSAFPGVMSEVVKSRTKRVQARWSEYRDKLREGLKNAQEFHGLVANTAHERTFMLYAADHNTEVGYDWSQEDGSRVVVASPGGDGTVPVASAAALDARVDEAWKQKLPGVLPAHQNVGAQEHTGVFKDQAVLDRVNLLVYFLLRLEKAAVGTDDCEVSSVNVSCQHKVKRKFSLKLPPAKNAKRPYHLLDVVAAGSGAPETITVDVALGKPRCKIHEDSMLVVTREDGSKNRADSAQKFTEASSTVAVYYGNVALEKHFPGWLWPWSLGPIPYSVTPSACHPATVGAVIRVYPAVEPSIEFEFELDTDDRVGEQMKKSQALGRVEKRGRAAKTDWTLKLTAKLKYGSRVLEISKEYEDKFRNIAVINRLVKKAIDRFSELFFRFTGVTLLPLFPKLSLSYEGKFKEIDGSFRVGPEWSITFKADPLIGLSVKVEILAVLIKALEKIPILGLIALGLEKIRVWAAENDQTFEIYLIFSGLIAGEVGGKKKAAEQKPVFAGSIEGKIKADFIAKASFSAKGIIDFELGAKVEAGTGLFAKLEAESNKEGVFLQGSFGVSACKFKYCAWASGKCIWEIKESVEGEYKFWDEIELGKTDEHYILRNKES